MHGPCQVRAGETAGRKRRDGQSERLLDVGVHVLTDATVQFREFADQRLPWLSVGAHKPAVGLPLGRIGVEVSEPMRSDNGRMVEEVGQNVFRLARPDSLIGHALWKGPIELRLGLAI